MKRGRISLISVRKKDKRLSMIKAIGITLGLIGMIVLGYYALRNYTPDRYYQMDSFSEEAIELINETFCLPDAGIEPISLRLNDTVRDHNAELTFSVTKDGKKDFEKFMVEQFESLSQGNHYYSLQYHGITYFENAYAVNRDDYKRFLYLYTSEDGKTIYLYRYFYYDNRLYDLVQRDGYRIKK
jgi:hypothetical protein